MVNSSQKSLYLGDKRTGTSGYQLNTGANSTQSRANILRVGMRIQERSAFHDAERGNENL